MLSKSTVSKVHFLRTLNNSIQKLRNLPIDILAQKLVMTSDMSTRTKPTGPYTGNRRRNSDYPYPVELFTTVLLVVISLGLGVGLLIYGVRGTRESQARDGRTYKRGRL